MRYIICLILKREIIINELIIEMIVPINDLILA